MYDYEAMRDWQHREENPGYEREIGLTMPDLVSEDGEYDPEIAELVVQENARENARRRKNNEQTEVARLRALLQEHGIDPDE